MKRFLAGTAITAALVGGSVAIATVSPLGIAAARNAPEAQTAEPAGRRMVLQGVLDELVAEGVITQDQADTIRERVRERIREYRGDRGGEGRARFREAMEQTVATAASTLGMEPADLVAELRAGKSLRQVAEEQGVDPAALEQAVVDDIVARIDAAVAEGHLDAERAEQAKAKVPDRVARLMDRTGPAGAPMN